ncbi:hypothetical protein C4585_02675 [Candidatus Parcubacteria bacterium]|nr:MAG: hypothetical protein C4585_02675 [Candidatus Parcubacteria bacterium]
MGKFFQLLGVIFFLLILAGVYFYFADPIGMRATLESVSTSSETGTTQKDAHPYLSDGQENALRAVGVDPSKLPSSFTAEQQACLIGVVGEARANEIKAGALPTPVEIFKAKDCL